MTDTLADTPLPAPGGRLIDAPIKPVRIAVLTVSDTRDEESDTSGQILSERVVEAGHACAARALVADEVEAIRAQVRAWTTSGEIDAVRLSGRVRP